MKKIERIITITMLFIISLSNVGAPVSYAAQVAVAKLPPPASNKIAPPATPPNFHQPDSGSVLGASTSLLIIGSQDSDTQNSASKRVPIRMQQLAKRVYQTDENVDLAVTDPDNDPFSTAVINAKGQDVSLPINETNDGTTTDVQIAGSNEVMPGIYTIKVTDNEGNVTTQDFSWGVLALNTDKSMYHPGETADLSMAVLDDQGNMVCNASLELRITNQEAGINDTLTTGGTGKNQIVVNPQCQQHDFSLQPDYQASYIFEKAGTYTLQLTATTTSGAHTITDTVPVTNKISFDIQRISATRIYPPNTYPMTFNITAHQDFNGTVTETVPQDFIITPATESATPVTSYTNMQTVYLQGNNPAANLEQAIVASGSGGLVMPFHGNYPITQGFGAQMTDPTLQAFYTQYGLAGHDGVDFGVPMDTPLYAVDDGNVIWSGPGDYGITIIIQHSWGQSYYGHLSTTAVPVGTHVTKGELIGYSGESGEATGPHLHFGIRPNNPDMTNGYYGKIDPLPYLPYNQIAQPTSSIGPSIALPTPTATESDQTTVLSASTSADASSSADISIFPTSQVTPSVEPTGTVAASPSATPISQTPTLIPSPTVETQPTTTITQSTTPPANTNITVLDKQILLNEQLSNNSETEKVKVITWHVTLQKGQSTSLGYDYQAPPQSPQFYLLGPMQFYQNGSNKVVFQEQRQWQIASDDVGVSWYTNTTPSVWNGYSWQYRKKITINDSNVVATPSAQTVDFMDSGGDATEDTTSEGNFWSGTSSSGPTVDCTVSETGPCSLKFVDTSSGSYIFKNGILSPSGRRISAYFKFDSFPSSDHDIYYLDGYIELDITSGGVLELKTNGTQIGSTGATLSTGTWYRIDLSYYETSTTVYGIKVYVNGVQSISLINGTTLQAGTIADLYIGLGNPYGASDSIVEHVDDIYVDSDTDLSDTGDVHVTAKLPIANGATNSFTPNGTPSNFTSCNTGTHCEYVNERPLHAAAFLQGPITSTTETFTIQNASSGDVNISSASQIAEEAWVYSEMLTTCTTPSIIVNGTLDNISLTTSYAMYTQIVNTSTYPSGNQAVGMDSCNGSGTHTLNLGEAGVQIAYIPDLNNFPVLINLPSDNDLKGSHTQSNGADILFTDSTGENLLPFEIENYNNSTGSLQAWVNISSLSTSNNTIIYMYFGNPSATSLANAHGTWNSNFSAVFHFLNSGGTVSLNDSTSNGYNGSNGGSSNIGTATGQIDGAGSYNGNAYDLMSYSTSFMNTGSNPFSATFWVNPTANGVQVVTDNLNTMVNQGWLLYIGSNSIGNCTGTNPICFYDQDGNHYGEPNAFTPNTWTSIGITKTGTTVTFYSNGVSIGTNTLSTANIPSNTTNPNINDYIGGDNILGDNLFGDIDEAEYSNVALSPGWIATEYNNQSSPSSFYSLGSVETSNYAPQLSQLLRHGEFFGTVGAQSGVRQPFTF